MKCSHPEVRCIHGDEISARVTLLDAILSRPYRRAACTTCDAALHRDLPRICTVTGDRHGPWLDVLFGERSER